MGLGLNDMCLKNYVRCAYDHASFQRRKAQQENTCHGRIIYQSDCNKVRWLAKKKGPSKEFCENNFPNSFKVLVFGQVNILSNLHGFKRFIVSRIDYNIHVYLQPII